MLVTVIAMHCSFYLSIAAPNKLFCTNPAVDGTEISFQSKSIDTLESQRYDFVPKLDYKTVNDIVAKESKQEMMGCRVTFQGKSHSLVDLHEQVFYEFPCSELRKKVQRCGTETE